MGKCVATLGDKGKNDVMKEQEREEIISTNGI